MMDDALALACQLIERESITPADGGCQALIGERLKTAGFTVEHLRFGEVDNLWAIAGDSGPILCFAGHTDVVPPGPAADWRYPPFEARIEDGWLHGRGAADMKAGVAAMVCAAERSRKRSPDHAGRIAFLLTSDEEGPAIDGTRRVIEWLAERETRIDYCVLGEPSSHTQLGDTIKNGRRGSLNGHITVRGVQGHVAYPQVADNALHRLLPLLNELTAHHWDDGDAEFPPTAFQISNIAAGTGAENVIPGTAEAYFNLRFNPVQTPDQIRSHIESRCAELGLDARIDWHVSGMPFVTRAGALLDATVAAVQDELGVTPKLSTGGGTSDGRYIAPAGAQVVELGPVNTTIHQVDERIRAGDISRLSRCFEAVIGRLLTP